MGVRGCNFDAAAARPRTIAPTRTPQTLGPAQAPPRVHRDRPILGELTQFISSAPIDAQVLEGEDAIR